MKKTFFTTHTVYLMGICIVFVAPYMFNDWWKYIPATVLILSLTMLFQKKQAVTFLGLKTDNINIVFSFSLLILLTFGFRTMLFHYSSDHNLSILSTGASWYVSVLFQSLNEEIVLRSILLKTLLKFMHSKFVTSCFSAILFALLHLCFYYFFKHVLLNLYAISALILFSLICNILFFTFKHIWYGYALHASWNLTRFTHTFSINHKRIDEGMLFNILEGTPVNLIILSCVFLLLLGINLFLLSSLKKRNH